MSGAAQMMAAWQSGEAGMKGLMLTNWPRPRASAGQALIRVEAAALNFSDLLMIDDRYQIRPPRPFVPGQEIAGTVETVGDGCTLTVGERVTGKVIWGGFADYAVIRGDMAIGIPPGIATVSAVALPIVYTTAMVALTESIQVKRGEDVLVLAAAGGVGLAAVEIAHWLGARVIAAAGGAEKCALARAHGADDVLDYRKSGWSETVKELTGGRGADVIVDPVGGSATKEALRALAWEGRLLVIGFSSGEIPMISASRLLLSRAAAIGVYWNHDRDAAMLARIAHSLTSLLASGAIRPHVGKEFPFAQLPQALTALAARQITGKAVVRLVNKDRPS